MPKIDVINIEYYIEFYSEELRDASFDNEINIDYIKEIVPQIERNVIANKNIFKSKNMRKGDFTTLGATAHSDEEREENDFYATDPKALEVFLDQTGIELRNVWECACGEGHLAKVLEQRELLGRASDLIDRGYGQVESNFFYYSDIWDGDILTNPPYGDAMKFCKHALDCVDEGNKVIMLMRIQFLEGQRRKPFLLANPPKYVYVSSSRLLLAKNADFVKYNTPSANCYAWYVWEKGFKGETTLRWFN